MIWCRASVAILALCIVPLVAAFQAPSSAGIGPPGEGSRPSEPGVERLGPGVTPPRVVTKFEPLYDPTAKEAKIEGEVLLSVVVDERGVPGRITVTRSLHPGLDAEAIKTVMAWRFEPAVKDGVKVAMRVTIAVRYHLI